MEDLVKKETFTNYDYRCQNIEENLHAFINSCLFLIIIAFQIQKQNSTFTFIIILFGIVFGVLGIVDYYSSIIICNFRQTNVILIYIITFSLFQLLIFAIGIAQFFIHPSTFL